MKSPTESELETAKEYEKLKLEVKPKQNIADITAVFLAPVEKRFATDLPPGTYATRVRNVKRRDGYLHVTLAVSEKKIEITHSIKETNEFDNLEKETETEET